MANAAPLHRWYHLTPDRFVIGLLLLECVLWLSEQFLWFDFNRHKGWTVLIAIEFVTLALLVGLVWCIVSTVFRRRFQFSVRSLLLLVVVIALPCSWLATEAQNAKALRANVSAIENGHGRIAYDVGDSSLDEWDKDQYVYRMREFPGPEWLWKSQDPTFFVDIQRVGFNNSSSHDCIEVAMTLPDLQVLDLDFINLTAKELKYLESLSRLQTLRLRRSNIDDDGLTHVEKMRSLKLLDLSGTKITSSGLKHLERLNQLRTLNLISTCVTDEGLAHVGCLRDLTSLDLSNTKITDAGLKHLEGLTQLLQLTLEGTQVKGVGYERLKGLPYLKEIHFPRKLITDESLRHIATLTQLEVLDLDGSQITDAGPRIVKGMPHLQQLSLNGTQISDAGLEYIHDMKQLLRLSLSETHITYDGLRFLKNMTQLEYLQITSLRLPENQLSLIIQYPDPEVRALYLRRITEPRMKELEQAMPNCRIAW